MLKCNSIEMHSKGIGIDTLVMRPCRLLDPVGSPSPWELFVNTKKIFCAMRPLDPSILAEKNPGI
jgi:hypothetical protein